MTREWINQYNRKCIEFMGYINLSPDGFDFNIYGNEKGMTINNKNYNVIQIPSMKFHSDWNWIMEVVEKISTLTISSHKHPIKCTIRKDFCLFYYESKYDQTIVVKSVIRGDCKNTKEAVVLAIDQFIDWYNEQKENETEVD